MEACLGLGRSQRNLNKQQQKELKLQDQHQQQQQHTQLQQQKQQTQAIITNQNYYTTQQQPQNQRHLAARGQTTNVGAQKPGVQQQQQQQQHNDESHLVKQQQQQQQQQQNVQHNTTPTPCTTTHKYRNTAAAATTTANMQQPSLLTLNDNTSGGGNAVQQQPQPQAISFQKNTVTVEVTPTLPSSVSPTNTPAIVTNANVKTFRKINRQAQQQQLQQQQQQQQQHQHQHLLHQQQQQQLEADLDAIEVCVDPEPHVSFKGGVGGLLRQTKTLGRLNHQHQHQHHHSIEDQHGQWANMSQTTSLQLLQLQQQQQHDYSYAYYEPGAAMRHTNIPHADLMAGANEDEDLTPPPPNSIRALLSKGKKNKLLVSPATRQSYQTRLTQQQSHNVAGATTAPANCSNISTPENFYEEISASSTSSSSNSMTSHHQLRATSHSAGSLNQTLVEEELRRVQNRHHKILGELNLSVEAMLMPESPPNSSPTAKEPQSTPSVSVTTASGQPLRLTSSSADNICDTALAGGPADDFISPIPNSATVSAGLLQSSCLAADLDSGFSGSSGASYIGSLRLHKTNALMCSRSNNPSSTTTAAAGGNAAAKSQQSAFAYDTQSCRSFQRANSNNATATATATSASVSASSSSAASATTSSCTIKHLPQIHHNTKHQQQQQLHMQHQHHQHHHSHLHQHHHHHHLHQQQQHQQSQHINDDLQNSSGFFTRASCGRRILNCAKIRAAEDPGPVVLNAQPNESKARSFWNRKGWRKLPGFQHQLQALTILAYQL
ncbi:hypothetical protein DOY81_006641, partial [Sarcophaga bullata]